MNFFTELIKFLGSPTRGKAQVLTTLIVTGFVLFLAYERYTATLRLGRLQKESDLIIRLQEIQQRGTNAMTPELIQLTAALLTNAVRTIEEKPISLEFVPSKLTFSFDNLWKCLWGGSLWIVIAIFYLLKSKSKSKDRWDTVKGFFVLAALSGIIGLFIPPILWPWFHIFILPWLLLIGALVILLPFAIVITNYQAAKIKASTNLCINNLRLIDAAKTQWALEKSNPPESTPSEQDLFPYFLNSIFPKCPTGGLYKINDVKTPPVCTEKGHHLSH